MASLEGKDEVLNELEKKSSQFARVVAMETRNGLVDETPVDTGRAKGNWQVARGSMDTTNDAPPDKNGNRVKAKTDTVIAKFQPGDTLFITNALPYIGVLADGWSDQAPSGWIDVIAARMQKRADNLARGLRG